MKILGTEVPRLVMLASVLLAGTGVVSAGSIPQSSCAFNNPGNPAAGFQCSLYPSDGSGNFNGDVNINFPAGWSSSTDPISPGFIVLDSQPGNIVADPNSTNAQPDDPNQSDWAQVLEFVDTTDTGASATYMTLFTIGCNSAGNPQDTSCFPSFNAVTEDPGGIGFVFEADANPAVNPVYAFNPDDSHSYTINFVPASTPEPSTFAIAFGGIALVAGLRRRRKSSR